MDFTNLKKFLDKAVNVYLAPGVDCVVYKEHEQVFRYYTGMRDIENKIPMDGNELYFIFSMTKMLTCTCALQLLEQGKYLMSDPVSMYLPEYEKMKITTKALDNEIARKIEAGEVIGGADAVQNDGYAKNQITIRDLFTMTAGLDYDLESESIKKALSEGRTSTRELVRAISETVLGFEPGTRFRYSLCHDVLGALIEVWSGQKFGEYMKENIFDKLGMKDTFFGKPKDEARLSRMPARYMYNEDRIPERLSLDCEYNLSEEYESGGAGLTSSAEDYALFLDTLANGGVGKTGNRILSERSVELMRTNHLSGTAAEDFDDWHPGYGYGLGVRTHMNPARSGILTPVGEFGWGGAAGAFSMVDPKNKISLTFFQHIHAASPRLRAELRNVVYGCLDK